jgi:hypothetical protein
VTITRQVFLERREELLRQVNRRRGIGLVVGMSVFVGTLIFLLTVPLSRFPAVLAGPLFLLGVFIAVWSASRGEKLHTRLTQELGLACPNCGLPAFDDAGELVVANGVCTSCGAVIFTTDEGETRVPESLPALPRSRLKVLIQEALPVVAFVVIIIAGALVPMPGWVQIAVSIAAFVAWFWGIEFVSAPARRRLRGRAGALPTRAEFKDRVKRYRRLARGTPIVMIVGIAMFVAVIALLVRAGRNVVPRVGVPFLAAYFMVLIAITGLWEGWIIATLELDCRACGADLVGSPRKGFSATANTLRTWCCYDCGEPVAL